MEKVNEKSRGFLYIILICAVFLIIATFSLVREVYYSPGEPCEGCVGYVSPLVRFFKTNSLDTRFPTNIAKISDLKSYYSLPEFVMLKNEGESFQLGYNSSGTRTFSLDYEVLYGGQSSNDISIELYKEDYANVTYHLYKNISDFSPMGYYTDPLHPYTRNEEITEEGNVLWWVTTRTSTNTKPGNYVIKFNITRDGYVQTFSVSVNVLNYALPQKSNFKAIFDLDYNQAKPEGYRPLDYHHALSTGEKNEVVNNYLSYMEKNKINTGEPYYDAACLDCGYIYYGSVAPMLPITALDLAGNSITVDFTSFDNSMQKYITNGHMNAFIISDTSYGFYRLYIPSFYGDNFFTQDNDNEEYAKFYNLYWGSVISHLEQKGWLDYAYIAIDEPFIPSRNGTYIRFDNNFTSLLRTINSEKPKVIVWFDQYTVNFQDNITDMLNIDSYNTIDSADNDNPLETLYDKMNSVKGEDDELGTYWTSNSHIHLDRPVIDNRIWGIKYWKYNMTSLYHWDVLMFTYMNASGYITNDNPWKSISHRWGAGGSTLFYPPCKTGKCSAYNSKVTPSIRSEMYRDSVEDYDYLTVLSNLIETAEDSGLNAGGEKLALDHLVSSDDNLKNWTRDINTFEINRKETAYAIASLYNKLYCGNDDVDEGEQCDDGNKASGDGCSSICTNEDIGGEDDDGDTGGPGGIAGIISQCNDDRDNDGDGKVDYPADPGCTNSGDNSELDVYSPNTTCIENWNCIEGACIDGIKRRECTDLNGCGTTTKKPLSEQECSEEAIPPHNKDNEGSGVLALLLIFSLIVAGIIAFVVLREYGYLNSGIITKENYEILSFKKSTY